MFQQAQHRGVQAPEQYLGTAVAFTGNHGDGEITLRSADPNDPPVINPNYLSHPFDRRVAIESVRETLNFINTPSIVKDQERLIAGPTGSEEEDILVREFTSAQVMLFWLDKSKPCADERLLYRTTFESRQ